MVKYIDLKTAKKVSTRIRRQYFDAIVAGEKKIEIRKLSKYWKDRIVLPAEEPKILVLLCGNRDVYRCEITSWTKTRKRSELIATLGREPSEQGWEDLGRKGPWLIMQLGEQVRDKKHQPKE